MRGLGPARQSAPYPLEQVAILSLNEQPLVEQGPVNPRALAVLGAWFLTRETELSLALCKNVTVVNVGGVLAVKWRLPASKTDPMAVAVVRELGCMCQGCSSALCPAHVAEEHFKTFAKLFGPNVPRDLPSFPSIDGQSVSKGAVVGTLSVWQEGVETLCWMIWDGEPLVDTQLVSCDRCTVLRRTWHRIGQISHVCPVAK